MGIQGLREHELKINKRAMAPVSALLTRHCSEVETRLQDTPAEYVAIQAVGIRLAVEHGLSSWAVPSLAEALPHAEARLLALGLERRAAPPIAQAADQLMAGLQAAVARGEARGEFVVAGLHGMLNYLETKHLPRHGGRALPTASSNPRRGAGVGLSSPTLMRSVGTACGLGVGWTVVERIAEHWSLELTTRPLVERGRGELIEPRRGRLGVAITREVIRPQGIQTDDQHVRRPICLAATGGEQRERGEPASEGE